MSTNPNTKRTNKDFTTVSSALVVGVLLITNCTVLVAVPLRSQKQGDRPVKKLKRIIGLLKLPSVFLFDESDVADDAELPAHPHAIRAYSKRSTESSIVALIQGPEDIETKEDPYKRAGAVVYDALDSWYLIGLKSYGCKLTGWVYVKNSNAFIGLEWLILFADNSGYVTPEWDGKLWTAPESRLKVRLLNKPATSDITVIQTKELNDELWLQVEFSERVDCDWKELPPVLAKG